MQNKKIIKKLLTCYQKVLVKKKKLSHEYILFKYIFIFFLERRKLSDFYEINI